MLQLHKVVKNRRKAYGKAGEEDEEPPKKKKKKVKRSKPKQKAKFSKTGFWGKHATKTKDKDKGSGSGQKDSGELSPPIISFSHTLESGLLKGEAISRVESSGLCIRAAEEVGQLPLAGRISLCEHEWSVVTADKWVLDIVREGYKVPFLSIPVTLTFGM